MVTVFISFVSLVIPLRLPAQEQQEQKAQNTPRYSLTVLDTLGGTFGEAYGLNNRGSVSGRSTLPGDAALHAFLWQMRGLK